MRADRLVAVLLLLQQRQRVTATELAIELEVSERTARRDLEALAVAGIPVYAERGRGGGWRLLGGGRTDLSGLTSRETLALFLVAGPSANTTPELKAALRKLVRALPEPFRDDAEGAATTIVVDPGGWGQTRTPRRPALLEELQEAAARGLQVLLGYRDRGGRPTTRLVDPLGLVLKGTVWYLVASTGGGLRTFRVSRATSVELTGERVSRPEGFDLADAWKEVVERVDELRSPATVCALADPSIVPAIQWMFERQVIAAEPASDGRVPITLRGQSADIIAARLAGFGRMLEVTEPLEARSHLARLAEELTATYSS